MKIVVSAIMLVATIAVCCSSTKNPIIPEPTPRIQLVQSVSALGISMSIVLVDGKHEYLTNYHGGIQHYIDCPCGKGGATHD